MRFLSLLISVSCLLITGCSPKPDRPSQETKASHSTDEPAKRRVFAHYMVCFKPITGEPTVENYKKEIQIAQGFGIDGFALNCGNWTEKEAYYKQRVLLIYEAARQLGSGFELFLSADFSSGLTLPELRDMVETFREHPNQFRHKGGVVLSTYGGSKTNEVTDFVAGEFPNDRKVFFVPYYQPRPSNELPSEREIREVMATHPTIDGFFYFGAAGAPDKLTAVSRKMSELWHEAGKLYMAPVTSFYRGLRGNYRVFESHGFQGMQDMWLAAIEGNADWVEILTWNDWGESTYIAPLSDEATLPVVQTHHGKLPPHGAFGEASRYYIEWFKQGHPPKITQDSLYYFYRMHPSTLKGPVDPPKERLEFPRGVSSLEDSVFVTVFLKEPATLKVTAGETTSSFELDSGVQNISIPMQPGTPQFHLIRDGKTIIDHAGEQAISADDVSTNFNYFCGGVTATPEKPLVQQP